MKTLIETETKFKLVGKIEEVKDFFEKELKTRLLLTKIASPLFVSKKSGFNDDLNGVEKAVSFQLDNEEHQVVHSSAKWKRWYLGEIKAPIGEGIVTDMRAIRANEVLSPIHSHLVDQWDWEKPILKDERTLEHLIEHGISVFQSLRAAEQFYSNKYGSSATLPVQLKIIHTEDLLQKFPELTPKEREHAIAKEFGAVLLIGVGGKLSNGERHDLRAPDYDDWTTKDESGRPGLNADILVWDTVRELSLEISSMGVRVCEEVLVKQLKEQGEEDRLSLPFHKDILEGRLPYSIGGGIGQSRVAMFVTKQKDIKEVQANISV